MKTLAHRIGFEEVDVCHDGEVALQMLKASSYDVVLCDLETHPMNGAEFARRARAEPCGSRCIIILTPASRESAARALADGTHLVIDGFLLKPFNSDDLKKNLLEIAERRVAKAAPARPSA